MKFKFNPDLEYQKLAVDSVVNIFRGQSSVKSLFSFNGVYQRYDLLKSSEENLSNINQGVGNMLELTAEDILKNVRRVQDFHRLAPSTSLSLNNLHFTVEMETGTGKTYVYLRTIFELNKRYGFTKFIIVVPSIAIKEGVYKTLEITEDHFRALYDDVLYDYFVYDSQRLDDIRNFAMDSHIKIMIINIDSFNKSFKNIEEESKVNIIHRSNDRLNGYKPIDLISQTNPFVIIDEPQSSANSDKSKNAIMSLNPLCTVGYSATPPKDSENLVYKLDAIDAYEMNLVKEIEVDSIRSDGNHNDAYLKLLSVDNKHSPITANIEMDVNDNGNVKRRSIKVKQDDDLSDIKLTGRSIYEGYIVDEIYCEEDNEYVSFRNGEQIYPGNATGEISENALKRQLIHMTIKEHLDKELKLKDKQIKVLSLFFIDQVSKYRQYDKDGNKVNGEYAEIFEEEYTKLIHKEKYKPLLTDKRFNHDLTRIHNGYFSIDSKGHFKDSKGKGKSNDDGNTYNLIMKDKEKLLSFDNPLRFIFSHSVLREGWDNPNVFQICTLNETKSQMKKRQEIGRGLRLCVNQEGNRIKDNSINILTIMANESYEEFAKSLQKEMEKDGGFKFGKIDKNFFASIKFTNRKGEEVPLEKSRSQQIFNYFKEKKYIDKNGKIQQRLKQAIHDNTLEVPEDYVDIKQAILEKIAKPASDYKPRNAKDRREIKLNKKVYLNDDFRQLWDKIKYKTTYHVDFSTEELIKHTTQALQENLDIKSPRFIYTKSGLQIDASGVKTEEKRKRLIESENYEIDLPDIVQFLQQETFLTRKTIIEILIQSHTLEQFKKNPQEYMEQALKIINKQLNHILVDGIKYTKNGEYYSQELFKESELYGYLTKNMIESQKSVYDHIVYDSQVECNFEKRLEKDQDVKVYTKLPGWFKIPTPIGSYNPDWAILVKDEEELQKLYFVIETKGNIDEDSLRPKESYKIKCAKKHFQAIGQDVKFDKVDSYDKFKEDVYMT